MKHILTKVRYIPNWRNVCELVFPLVGILWLVAGALWVNREKTKYPEICRTYEEFYDVDNAAEIFVPLATLCLIEGVCFLSISWAFYRKAVLNAAEEEAWFVFVCLGIAYAFASLLCDLFAIPDVTIEKCVNADFRIYQWYIWANIFWIVAVGLATILLTALAVRMMLEGVKWLFELTTRCLLWIPEHFFVKEITEEIVLV